VGRIEPRKNQLALITALRHSTIPLTLVGAAGRFSGAYERRCRAAAGTNVTFLGSQPAESLPRIYAAARVHACVSWYETPGLASLEAALCGCGLVLTPGGCTREYFGDEAAYARADDPASIRAAVEVALQRGPAPTLRARIAREFTWAEAARHTATAYQFAISTAPVVPTGA
jgi:glycosyltransferase involved in cell wall biosynthesis